MQHQKMMKKLPLTCYIFIFCHGVMFHAKFILTDKVSSLKNNWGGYKEVIKHSPFTVTTEGMISVLICHTSIQSKNFQWGGAGGEGN